MSSNNETKKNDSDIQENPELRTQLTLKLAGEIKAHNALSDVINTIDQEQEMRKVELQQRRGRVSMLQDQVAEVGGPDIEIFQEEGLVESAHE